MSKITYMITDPDRHYHTVVFANGEWYGEKNLGMGIDDKDLRWYTIRKLKQLMLAKVEDKWAGFEWVPID